MPHQNILIFKTYLPPGSYYEPLFSRTWETVPSQVSGHVSKQLIKNREGNNLDNSRQKKKPQNNKPVLRAVYLSLCTVMDR